MDRDDLTMICEGFAKDSTGKIWAMPCKFDFLTEPGPITKKDSEGKVRVTKRPYIPIKPIKMDFGESSKGKRRKTERPICKELFKVPPQKVEKRLSSLRNRQSLTKSRLSYRSTSAAKSNLIKKQVVKDRSPLVNIDEAEKLFKGPISKSNGTNLLSFSSENKDEKNKTPVKVPDTKITTPTANDSFNAELEFLQLEKCLASVKKSAKRLKIESPLTSVCALMENTKITVTQDDLLNNISAIMQEDQEDVAELQKQIANFQKRHEDRMMRIKELVGGKDQHDGRRRSFRIAAQSVKTKFVVSPAIAKKVDLRKTTLNKNLSKNLQSETPSKKVPVDTVMSGGFCTPRINKTITSLAKNSVTKSLSQKLKNQCLLLQDTPKSNQ